MCVGGAVPSDPIPMMPQQKSGTFNTKPRSKEAAAALRGWGFQSLMHFAASSGAWSPALGHLVPQVASGPVQPAHQGFSSKPGLQASPCPPHPPDVHPCPPHTHLSLGFSSGQQGTGVGRGERGERPSEMDSALRPPGPWGLRLGAKTPPGAKGVLPPLWAHGVPCGV